MKNIVRSLRRGIPAGLFCLAVVLLGAAAGSAQPPRPGDAQTDTQTAYVNLPLASYDRLVEQTRDPEKDPPAAPAQYALGPATIQFIAAAKEEKVSAVVNVELTISILEDEWTAVPVLPAGTAVTSATLNNNPVQLISNPRGLLWGAKTAGSYQMRLQYSVDGRQSEGGISFAVPVPQAASATLTATIPGVNLEAAVIPSAGVQQSTAGDQTRITAAVPTTSGIHLSWRGPNSGSHTLSRASYRGEVQDEAVVWSGELSVEIFGDKPVKLKLLPATSTLSDVQVDGASAPVLVEDNYFVTRISGKGAHKVSLNFRAPVKKDNGPPQVELNIHPIPISRFELKLPGKKEVKVSPLAHVSHEEQGDSTVATIYLPMTERVVFSWNEAVPEDLKEEVRANASIYHLAYAEEGALYLQAVINYEVTRGETSLIELKIPQDVQVNRVVSADGLIADWRVAKGEPGKLSTLSVFLDRKLEHTLDFEVFYDRSILGEKAKEEITIPLVSAVSVHRQRGMAALLSSKELTLKPEREEKLTRVGENQLPPFIREKTDKTIAHTYKYVEAEPTLIVKAAKPERKQGKYDAMVNTLISLSDVTMKGSASVEVNVKSGAIQELELVLPPNVNFLSLTAPSLRTHRVNTADGVQVIDVQFTQEMEGQFRIEAAYEKIMGDNEASAAVPTITVRGAEVEQGRIAVEALSAVEVQPAETKQLSSLEPSELPQQLILKTSNPILLAYKYVYTDPPYALSLKITRHKEIDVQSATIDNAHYRTLLTEDGLAVTAASFTVRNSRKQFLRVTLPAGSTVWSAFVDGKAEKPALAEGKQSAGGPEVLIKIINSATGFPVQILYQTPVSEIGRLGIVDASLPRPDMVTMNTRWDVYVPEGISYGKPDTNMKIVEQARYLSREAIAREVAQLASGRSDAALAPPQLSVPAAGLRYSFEKLYANQSAEDAYIRIPYAAGAGKYAADALLVLGAAMIWYGLLLVATRRSREALHKAAGYAVGGAAVLALMIGYFGADSSPAVVTSALIAATAAVYLGVNLRQARAPQSPGEILQAGADEGAAADTEPQDQL